jgi:hypothetical protein
VRGELGPEARIADEIVRTVRLIRKLPDLIRRIDYYYPGARRRAADPAAARDRDRATARYGLSRSPPSPPRRGGMLRPEPATRPGVDGLDSWTMTNFIATSPTQVPRSPAAE